MEISEQHDPVPALQKKAGRHSSAFRIAISALELNKAVTIKDANTKSAHSNISSRCNQIGKEYHPRRRYSVSRISEGTYQVERTE